MGVVFRSRTGLDGIVYRGLLLVLYILSLSPEASGQGGFRVRPYLQNPAPDGMTVIWFSEGSEPGTFMYRESGAGPFTTLSPVPEPAESLAYTAWEESTFFNGNAPDYPYRQRVRAEDLEPATTYEYTLIQDDIQFGGTFRTAPAGNAPARFILYADSETEPESTGKNTSWADPVSGNPRPYLVDQTTGYRNNLEVIRSRDPDLVFVVGDLVQSGGEQRDWDEFWVHNAGVDQDSGLAGRVPLLAAPGNHEYYGGPLQGGYDQPDSEQAVNRYLTYFEYPENHSPNKKQEGRYYAITYGPASFIVLDVCNNSPNGTAEDTNFRLLGENDPGGGEAPDFGIGSRQYEWMEEQLAEAQAKSPFTFILLHHAPYSSGPHGPPPDPETPLYIQSGVPVRQLTPVFLQYGVDAVFSGHDEIWERSEVTGTEIVPAGSPQPHTIHFYDLGTGGDGLRGPVPGTENPNQEFLAFTDAPEVWEDTVLVDGGRHYGHLEVDIGPAEGNHWKATLKPVYIMPAREAGETQYRQYERRVYDDTITLIRTVDSTGNASALSPGKGRSEAGSFFSRCYPNPFRGETLIGYDLPEPGEVTIRFFDLRGRALHSVELAISHPGYHEYTWDGTDEKGNPVPPGICFCRIVTGAGLEETLKVIIW